MTVGITRQKILDNLDKIPEISNWRASIGAIFIAGAFSVRELGEKIHGLMPDLLYLLSSIDMEKAAGWTDRQTWDFIQIPKGSWEK